MESPEDQHALHLLRGSAYRWMAISGLMTLSGGLGLLIIAPAIPVQRWIATVVVVFGYELIFIFRRLAQNRRTPSGELLPNLGLGTTLTLLRGVMLAWVAGFVFIPQPDGLTAWLPMALYTVAILLDLFDGYAARTGNHVTGLGEALDVEFDALGLAVAISLAVWYRSLPVWYLLVGFSRYLFLAGMAWRRRRGLPLFDLPESESRRPIAGLTLGFSSAAIWPIVTRPGMTLAALFFVIPFSFSFVRDWLVVRGGLDPESSGYLNLRARAKSIAFKWFPLIIRGLVLLGILSVLILNGSGVLVYSMPDEGDAFRSVLLLENALMLALILAAILWILGIAGRFTAFLVVFPLGLTIVLVGLTPALALLLVIDLFFLFFGTGQYSLWEPEKTIFSKRWGEKRD